MVFKPDVAYLQIIMYDRNTRENEKIGENRPLYMVWHKGTEEFHHVQDLEMFRNQG